MQTALKFPITLFNPIKLICYLFSMGDIIMDNLLKEAIADAKAVRETALQNAKIALEEAFTPKIQSMLSQKIQQEIDDEDELGDEVPGEEEEELPVAPELEPEVEEDDEFGGEVPGEGEEELPVEPELGPEEDGEFGDDDAVPYEDENEVIEINGVKYAPIVSEEDEEGAPVGEPELEDEPIEDELDLESILRELEIDEADDFVDNNEAPTEKAVDEDYHEQAVGDGLSSDEVETADQADLAENDVSSDIGQSDNKVNAKAADTSATGAQGPEGEGSDVASGKENEEDEVVDDLTEELDLEEILTALNEEDEEDEEEVETESLKSDLAEHRKVVKYLRSKLTEVNLLNAKLLFTNKLFRSFPMNNVDKLRVVETFDRAVSLREVKLVYSTLAESFGGTVKTKIKENKGSASKAVGSTKPKTKKILKEGSDLKNRFQKLAGIL